MPYRRAMRRDQIALQLYTVRRPWPPRPARDPSGGRRMPAIGAVELAGLPRGRTRRARRPVRRVRPAVVAAHEGIDGPARGSRRRRRPAHGPRLRPDRRPVDARGGPGVRRRCPPVCGRARRLAGAARGPRVPARLPQPRRRVRAARRDHGLGRSCSTSCPRASSSSSTSTGLSVAGRDPVAEIRAAADRVRLLHMKDRSAGPDAARRPGRVGDPRVPGDRRGRARRRRRVVRRGAGRAG